MTEQELQQSIDATGVEMQRLRAELAEVHREADEALADRDHEKARHARERFSAMDADIKQLDATFALLHQVVDGLRHAPPVNRAIVWQEAVESRVQVARMGKRLDDPAVKAEWRDEMALMLDAKSFYWSAQMVSVVKESSKVLPLDTVLEPDMFPVKAGWWWFGKENPHLVIPPMGGAGKSPRRVASMAWLLEDDRVWVAAFSCDWPELGTTDCHTVWHGWLMTGRTAQEVEAEFPNVHKTPDASTLFSLYKFLIAGLLFLRQRVLVSAPQVIGRGARRRLEQHTSEVELQVVHLRRAETLRGHIGQPGEHASYSCQFWVRGHWRQQPYKDGVRPKWIDPFIKGDPDAPMKTPTEKVFAVVR